MNCFTCENRKENEICENFEVEPAPKCTKEVNEALNSVYGCYTDTDSVRCPMKESDRLSELTQVYGMIKFIKSYISGITNESYSQLTEKEFNHLAALYEIASITDDFFSQALSKEQKENEKVID